MVKGLIWKHFFVTLFEVLAGFLIGATFGCGIAILSAMMSTFRRLVSPYMVALQVTPRIAIAPIVVAWLGFNTEPKIAIAAIICFFPIFINTVRGLTSVEPAQIELMESYAASKWRITREVRIPNSLPFFFTALKLASSLAVIAAIVAEYFGGRQDALGPLITQSAGLTRYDDAWAAVVAGTAIGTVLYAAAVTLERLAMPWHSSIRQQQRGAAN